MGKISQLKSGLTARMLFESVGVFAATLGLASATASFLPIRQWNWRGSLAVIGGAAAAAVAVALFRARPRQLPEDLLLDDEANACSIAVTTDCKILRRVNDLAAIAYPGIQPLDVRQYEEWLAVNPNILVTLHDKRGRLQGYFDVFPLDASFLQQLMDGTYDEQDIRTEHILPPLQGASAQRLYLAGIAVRDAASTPGKWHGAMLLSALTSYFRHFYGAPNDKEIVAVGATQLGEQLLEKLGFQIVVGADHRKDGNPCYMRRMDRDLFKRLSPAVRDWSDSCRISWEVAMPTSLVSPR